MKELTKKEYISIFKSYTKKGIKLNVVSSFSDSCGILPFGYGCPAMDTTWGIGEKEVAKIESRKEYESDEWVHKYYSFI